MLTTAAVAALCQIWVDTQNVSHLKAKDDTGAYACLGYAQARDRGWQMDHLRRLALGRSAEVYGKEWIRSDYIFRLLDLEGRAKKLESELPAREREHFKAYTRGVNAGLATARSRDAYEFKRFGYQAEPWQLHHSIAILLLQSFEQTRKTFETDIKEHGARPEDFASQFVSAGLPWDTSILKPGEFARGKNTARATQPAPDASIPRASGDATASAHVPASELGPWLASIQSSPGAGSNNWVLSPARSKSAYAWLANDPHLDLVHPPFWYWVHLEGGGVNVIGSTLPGAPVISAGATLHAAWGLTNSYLDVADVELVPRKTTEVVESRPVIWFKWGPFKLPFFFKTVQRLNSATGGGDPILPLETGPDRIAVLHWSGFSVAGTDFAALHDLLLAKSAVEVDRAITHAGLPSWNFVFADTRGTIGYRANGRIPRHADAIPQGGLPRSTEAPWAAWPRDGYLTAEETPHLFNPKRGYVATANNRQWPASNAPFDGGRAYSPGFRAFRIEEMLTRESRHDFESLRKIQCDTQAVDARWFAPELLGALDPTVLESKRDVVAEIREWAGNPANPSYDAGIECAPCALYRRWVDLAMATTSSTEAGLYRFLRNHPGGLAQRSPITRAFEQALSETTEGTSTGAAKRRWGQVHQVGFRHLSRDPGLAGPWFESPGDKHSVNPGTLEWNPSNQRFEQTAGASQRLLVEMTHPPTVYATLAGPNLDVDRSGAGSGDSTRDPWRPWLDCRTERRIFPLDWSRLEADPKTRDQIEWIQAAAIETRVTSSP